MLYLWLCQLHYTISAIGSLCQLPNLLLPYIMQPFLPCSLCFLEHPKGGGSKLLRNVSQPISQHNVISQKALIFFSAASVNLKSHMVYHDCLCYIICSVNKQFLRVSLILHRCCGIILLIGSFWFPRLILMLSFT
jgi:hypothetical protein